MEGNSLWMNSISFVRLMGLKYNFQLRGLLNKMELQKEKLQLFKKKLEQCQMELKYLIYTREKHFIQLYTYQYRLESVVEKHHVSYDMVNQHELSTLKSLEANSTSRYMIMIWENLTQVLMKAYSLAAQLLKRPTNVII